MVKGIDSSVLLTYMQARSGLTATAPGAGGKTAAVRTPTPPWNANSGVKRASALVTDALAGKGFINESSAQLDVAGAGGDYRKLFALYQGLNTLYGLADRASQKSVGETETARLQSAFDKGLKEVSGYVGTLKLDQIRLTEGAASTSAKTTIGATKDSSTYRTGTLFTGGYADLPPNFQGAVAFDVTVKRLGVTKSISIDLSDMGSTPRTFGNVVAFMNTQMQAAGGVNTRFAMQRTTAPPREITVGGQKVTLPPVGDAFSLQVNADSAEQVSFSAAATAPAVYLATRGGDPNPDKDKTTEDAVYASTLSKTALSGLNVDGAKVFSQALDANVQGVRAMKTAADGSLYVLADVKQTINDQAVRGTQDVVLQKYDSAGKLMYSRTLGAADQASGLALAVSADGQVAIAGSVTGRMQGATDGPLNSAADSDKSDSFVTLYDAKGDEVWTQRRGGQDDDEAQAVAFGDGGVVYVAGRTRSALPSGGGAVAAGGTTPDWDGYLMAVGTSATGAAKTLFTRQFGTAGDDGVTGLAVSGGQVVVGGQEDKNAVLRAFSVTTSGVTVTRTTTGGTLTVKTDTYVDGALTGSTSQGYANVAGAPDGVSVKSYVSSANATTGAVRDLGDLQGGTLAGLQTEGGQIYVAGTTRNAALSVGGAVGGGYSGGLDVFAAKLNFDLSGSGDSLAYMGAAGDEKVSGMAVTNGQVWVAGKASAGFPPATPISAADGFLAGVDMTSGGLVASQRLTGKDGFVDNVVLAVDTNGASALDKLGLPKGTLTFGDSQKLTAASAVRAGDSFQVRNKEGGAYKTVTIDANETLASLAAKVSGATGFSAKVEVVSEGQVKRLKISPANANATIELASGKPGADALEALGLPPGVIRQTVIDSKGKTISADGEGVVFGLNLARDYDLSDKTAIKSVMDSLMAAIGVVQKGYRELTSLANPIAAAGGSGHGKTGGQVPAYLTNQIASYNSALARLRGG